MQVHVFAPAGVAAGLAVAAHGRNGGAQQAHMVPVIEACLERGLIVAAPDLCHSAGNDAPGDPARFTMAAHCADVATVVEDAFEMAPHGRPRLLIGHSMGSFAACAIAARRKDVTGVLALSPVISGDALLAARRTMGENAIAALREEVPDALTEWPLHTLAETAGVIAAPVAAIVGADDTLTPPEAARRLLSWVKRPAGLEVVAGEHHCPVGGGFSASLRRALDALLRG